MKLKKTLLVVASAPAPRGNFSAVSENDLRQLEGKVQLNLRHHGKHPQRRVRADDDGDVDGNGEPLVWLN